MLRTQLEGAVSLCAWCLRRVMGFLLGVVLRRSRRPLHNFEDIRWDQIETPQHSHTRAISVKQLSVLYELFQFKFCELHKPVDLVLGAVEVLETEGVNRHDLDAALVTDLEHLPMHVS